MARRLLTVLLPAALACLAGRAAGQEALRANEPRTAAEAPPGSLAGEVVSSRNGAPVAGALVLVRDARGREVGAVTGRDGRYRLPRLPPGHWSVKVSTLDHDTFRGSVRVPRGESVQLDVVLPLRPVVLPTLSAVTDPVALVPHGGSDPDPDGDVRGSQGDPELRALDAGPGGASLVRAMEGARGNPPRNPSSVLYVRGGAADLKRVLLDGAPVYAPFHLGGLMDAVPDGVFRSARLYTGGPAGLRRRALLRPRPQDPERRGSPPVHGGPPGRAGRGDPGRRVGGTRRVAGQRQEHARRGVAPPSGRRAALRVPGAARAPGPGRRVGPRPCADGVR